jgi:ribosomal protein L5
MSKPNDDINSYHVKKIHPIRVSHLVLKRKNEKPRKIKMIEKVQVNIAVQASLPNSLNTTQLMEVITPIIEKYDNKDLSNYNSMLEKKS